MRGSVGSSRLTPPSCENPSLSGTLHAPMAPKMPVSVKPRGKPLAAGSKGSSSAGGASGATGKGKSPSKGSSAKATGQCSPSPILEGPSGKATGKCAVDRAPIPVAGFAAGPKPPPQPHPSTPRGAPTLMDLKQSFGRFEDQLWSLYGYDYDVTELAHRYLVRIEMSYHLLSGQRRRSLDSSE